MKTLNGFYAEAEKIGGSSYLEGCLACATAYFIFLCMETHYEKVPTPRPSPLPQLPRHRLVFKDPCFCRFSRRFPGTSRSRTRRSLLPEGSCSRIPWNAG